MGNYYKPKLSERCIAVINCWAIFLILLGILLLALGYGLPGPLTAGLFALRIIGFLLLGIGLLLLLWACFYCCAKYMNKKADSYKEYRTKSDGAWVYLTPNSQRVYQEKNQTLEVSKEKASSSALANPSNDQFYSPPFVREFKTVSDKTISPEPLYPKYSTVHNKQFAWTKNTVVEVDKHNIKQGILHEELVAYPISNTIIFSPPPPYEEGGVQVSRVLLNQGQNHQIVSESSLLERESQNQQSYKDQALIHLSNQLQERLEANASTDISSGLHENTGVKTIYVSPEIIRHHRDEKSSHTKLSAMGQNSVRYDNTGLYQTVGKSSMHINPGIQQQYVTVNNEEFSHINQGNVMSSIQASGLHQTTQSDERVLQHSNLSHHRSQENSSIVIDPAIQQWVRVAETPEIHQNIIINDKQSHQINSELHHRQDQSLLVHSEVQPFISADGSSSMRRLPGSNKWVSVANKPQIQKRFEESSSLLYNPVTEQWVTVKEAEQKLITPGVQHFVLADDISGSTMHSGMHQMIEQKPSPLISPDRQGWVTVEHKSSSAHTSPRWMKVVEDNTSASVLPTTQQWMIADDTTLRQRTTNNQDWLAMADKSSMKITPVTETWEKQGNLTHSTPVTYHMGDMEEDTLIKTTPGSHHWVAVEERSTIHPTPGRQYWTTSNGIFSTRTTPRMQRKILTEEKSMTHTLPRTQQWVSPGQKSISPISTGTQHWITAEGKFPVKSSEIHHKVEEISSSRSHADWIYSSQNSNSHSKSGHQYSGFKEP